jgi:hypothetical protein
MLIESRITAKHDGLTDDVQDVTVPLVMRSAPMYVELQVVLSAVGSITSAVMQAPVTGLKNFPVKPQSVIFVV